MTTLPHLLHPIYLNEDGFEFFKPEAELTQNACEISEDPEDHIIAQKESRWVSGLHNLWIAFNKLVLPMSPFKSQYKKTVLSAKITWAVFSQSWS